MHIKYIICGLLDSPVLKRLALELMAAVNTRVGHSRFWIQIDAGLVTREAAGEVRHRSQMKSSGGICQGGGGRGIK